MPASHLPRPVRITLAIVVPPMLGVAALVNIDHLYGLGKAIGLGSIAWSLPLAVIIYEIVSTLIFFLTPKSYRGIRISAGIGAGLGLAATNLLGALSQAITDGAVFVTLGWKIALVPVPSLVGAAFLHMLVMALGGGSHAEAAAPAPAEAAAVADLEAAAAEAAAALAASAATARAALEAAAATEASVAEAEAYARKQEAGQQHREAWHRWQQHLAEAAAAAAPTPAIVEAPEAPAPAAPAEPTTEAAAGSGSTPEPEAPEAEAPAEPTPAVEAEAEAEAPAETGSTPDSGSTPAAPEAEAPANETGSTERQQLPPRQRPAVRQQARQQVDGKLPRVAEEHVIRARKHLVKAGPRARDVKSGMILWDFPAGTSDRTVRAAIQVARARMEAEARQQPQRELVLA
ncbi:hypothetical protein ACWDTT_10660 [Streptosporangium sandarakinum]